MSVLTLTVMALSFLVGLSAQAFQTGTLFGIVTMPQSWVPYLTLVSSFLGGALASIESAQTVSASTVAAAIGAGLTAVVAAGGGAAAHLHMTAHKTLYSSPPPAALDKTGNNQ